MNIKTFIAAAVVALTAACTAEETPAPVDANAAASNPADRDHSEAREAHAPVSK
jgi:hypothetical protein